jgi:hypothetical protein
MQSPPHKLVSSWSALCAEVERAEKDLRIKAQEELWFRGVSKQSHRLLPSLFRGLKKSPKISEIKDLENDLFFEFLAKARFTEGTALSEWDVLFLMQHYRTPTRLLDWTEVLHVAVYFALDCRQQDEPEPARIYVMNPYHWNEKHGYDRDLYSPRYFGWDEKEQYYYDYGEILVDDAYIDWEYPCALYPAQRDVRLSAQRGYFTIHGHDVRPLDKISPELLRAIDIDRDGIADCRQQLRHSGTDEFALFPDLEGLSRKLRRKYNC